MAKKDGGGGGFLIEPLRTLERPLKHSRVTCLSDGDEAMAVVNAFASSLQISRRLLFSIDFEQRDTSF